MLIPKIIDAIVLGTTKEQDNYYALNHVYLDDNKIYSSNGHSLYYAPTNTWTDEDDYPNMNSDTNQNYLVTSPVLLPAVAINKAIKNRPKKATPEFLNEHIQLSHSPDKINLTTTDLDTTDIVAVKNNTTLEFPAVSTIINTLPDPDNSSEVKNVNLSIAELELLCKVAKKAGEEYVRLTVKDECTTVRITPHGNSFTAVIMPVRRD